MRHALLEQPLDGIEHGPHVRTGQGVDPSPSPTFTRVRVDPLSVNIRRTSSEAVEAMELLIHQSQHQNVKLREIASEIVQNAMRRPRP